jgi:hypothetical protein
MWMAPSLKVTGQTKMMRAAEVSARTTSGVMDEHS